MNRLRTAVLTLLAMLAFAGNSLLCRAALADGSIDPASFTTLRIASGAAVLWLLLRRRGVNTMDAGSWPSALALFAYAACFSFAYVQLGAATGALLLFGAVQATMIGWGMWRGERFGLLQASGLVMAMAGLVGLLLPGLAAPPWTGALVMIAAGVAWGIYSLRGRGAGDATSVTAGNFLRAVPMAAVISVLMLRHMAMDADGIVLALLSGAVTSGLGYAIWYSVLPALRASHAATVQLSVPVIAAAGGIVLLGEELSLRLVVASLAILGGIALVIGGGGGAARTVPGPDQGRGAP